MKTVRLYVLVLVAFAVAVPLTVAPAAGVAAKQESVSKKKTAAAKKTIRKASKKKSTRSRLSSAVRQQYKFAALVVDADTGRVLYEKNAGATRYPASLTKMMTLYLAFDALKKGTLHIGQPLPVSKKAAEQPQTNIALKPGDRLPVKTAIESLVVRSANDSAMVLAEAIGQTQWNFALLMTKKARQLGMKDTVFRNPNGLPDTQQHTTAYDMARLGIALRRDFPEYYHFFSLREFSFNGVNYLTHNRVLEEYDGADGIKTGYIRASGFNLVTSAKRGGHHLVAVIMGGESSGKRDRQMVDLLNRTFAQLEGHSSRVADFGEDSDIGSEISELVARVVSGSAQAADTSGR